MGGGYAYTPSGVSSFAMGKRSRGSGAEGQKNSTGDEKRGAEEARVTEEFRNDRRPVASLTDDALLRSRLQAQKDGTAVMDSKWLEIVGRCHRASCLSLCFLYFYLPPSFVLSSSQLSLSSLIPRTKLSWHAMHSLKERESARVELHEILVCFLHAFEFPLTRARP